MRPVADVIATFAVHAGTTATVQLDDVTDPDMVALYLIEDTGELVDVSVCHQCAQSVVDPEVGELAGFTIAGVTYEKDEETGHWVPSDGGDVRRSDDECRCVFSCADDPPTACHLSGQWHTHPDEEGGFGPCPAHPDAPGDV